MSSKRLITRVAGSAREALAALVSAADVDAAIGDGRVFANGKRVFEANADAALEPGVALEVFEPRREAESSVPRIVRRAGDLVIIDKPAGLATLPDWRGLASAASWLAETLHVPLASVHATSRLDVPVSGLVVFALSPKAARHVDELRDGDRVTRAYLAIGAGPLPERGAWTGALEAKRSRGSKRLSRVAGPSASSSEAAEAETRFESVATGARAATPATLFAAQLRTGRMHQVRAHAAAAGAPLYGDREYGGPSSVTLDDGSVESLERIALHAERVELIDLRGGPLAATSAAPASFARVWALVGGAPELLRAPATV